VRWTTRLSFLAALSLATLHLHAQCGVERWSIKTGTDSGAPSINLSTYISSTIYNFYQSTRPSTIPSNSRVAPRETNQYSLSGTLTKYKLETDSDYHLVVVDGAGRTLVIEIPSPNCVGAGSPFGPGISNARRQFNARFTVTTSFKTTSTPVTIKGIGFWDFLHGQTGMAPNGIEVHPVLDITFGTSAASVPNEGNVAAAEVADAIRYPADVVRDNDGGLVRVFRGGDVLGEALYHGGAVVERPSLHVVFLGRAAADESARVTASARALSGEDGFRHLDRYGVAPFGMRVSSTRLDAAPATMTDLDVQRILSNAVEEGRLQHTDESTIYVVVLPPGTDAVVGETRNWLSYHSEFHPDDLAMRYVVVRGGIENFDTALAASVYRALVNPSGNGWF
jgi:hypothetical protein